MASPDPITLLHVSDMQFGRNHRFGRLGAYDPDASFDALLQSLTDDLDSLEQSDYLVPQMVVASGDLAEWGWRNEFEQAREFLDRLASHLRFGHDRVIIVPGNHDISRNSCDAYFKSCEEDGQTPVPPFWPKWKQYAHSFEEFYQALAPRFTVVEPWTWYEIPELKLVVAGLNSTISEIHNIPETDPRHVGSSRAGYMAILDGSANSNCAGSPRNSSRPRNRVFSASASCITMSFEAPWMTTRISRMRTS